VETVLGFNCLKFRNRRLRTNDEFDFRNHIHYDLAVGSQCVQQLRFPGDQVVLAFAQDLVNEFSKRRHQSAVKNIAMKLVKFSRQEIPTLLSDRFVKLPH